MGPEKHCVFYPVRAGAEFNLVLLRPDNLPANARTVRGDIGEMRATFDGWDQMYVPVRESEYALVGGFER
jgi:salicylate hydroxylase